jgi:hypothetical protein
MRGLSTNKEHTSGVKMLDLPYAPYVLHQHLYTQGIHCIQQSSASEISTTTINSFESAAGPMCDFTTGYQTPKPTSQTLVGNSHGVKSIAKWSKIALQVILGSHLQSH